MVFLASTCSVATCRSMALRDVECLRSAIALCSDHRLGARTHRWLCAAALVTRHTTTRLVWFARGFHHLPLPQRDNLLHARLWRRCAYWPFRSSAECRGVGPRVRLLALVIGYLPVLYQAFS